MFWLVLFFICLFDHADTYGIANCPDEWIQVDRGGSERQCYKLYQSATYETAEEICRDVHSGYLAAPNYNLGELIFVADLCGRDGSLCWTSGGPVGWDEDSCNPDAIDCWYYADFLTDFIEEYSNSTDVGMVISGRTWSLSLLNKTEELPFICEASLKDRSVENTPSVKIPGDNGPILFASMCLISGLGLAYAYTRKPPDTSCFGYRIQKNEDELNHTTTIHV